MLPVLPAEDPARNHLGLNTWFHNDWDGSFAFVDVMKHARPWSDAAWKNPAPVDSLGWPTSDASTVLFTGSPAQVNGLHKLSFNGQATVKVMWVAGTVSNQVYDAATNTTTADVTFAATGSGSGGLQLTNTKRTASSATNSGFTNAHLYRPGYPSDGSAVFTTPFLNGLAKASVVRMMDWTSTNMNIVQHWSDRITPNHATQAGLPCPAFTDADGKVWSGVLGVAIEHQIQLCNALKNDCWINIPVLADDDYVQKLALTLRYGSDGTNPYTSVQANPVYPPLDPSLHVYLEYANEIWNSAGGFQCFGLIHSIVNHLDASHPLLTPSTSNIYVVMWRYPAFRMALISDIFRSVYGDASMMNRVRPLLETQAGDTQATLSSALTWLDGYAQAHSREVSSYLFGGGGSGYYGVQTLPANHGDADAFFASGNFPEASAGPRWAKDSAWAANFGLKHIAYEGGPSLDNFSTADANTINGDARMQGMVTSTHDLWSSVGGDLLVYYTLRGPGSWEFTWDLGILNTPKMLALDQLKAQPRAAITLGPALPGTLIATDWTSNKIRIGYDYSATFDGLPCQAGNDQGEWLAYPAHANSAFTGNLVVNGQTNATATVAVWINGVNKGQVTLAASAHLADSTPLQVDIPAGLVVIRLQMVTSGINLRSISVN